MMNVLDCLGTSIVSPFERAVFIQMVETLIVIESS